MHLNGIKTEVVVDDYFPCYSNSSNPIFARPNGNEIWVMILEKACAKVHGSYNNISHRYIYEPMGFFWDIYFECYMYNPIHKA